jgi:hypothetical protein
MVREGMRQANKKGDIGKIKRRKRREMQGWRKEKGERKKKKGKRRKEKEERKWLKGKAIVIHFISNQDM